MLLLLAIACATGPERGDLPVDTGEPGIVDEEQGWVSPTGYECPPGGTALTWDNFGRQFFVDYCEECHNHEAPAPGVPTDLVFDNEAIVWDYQERIIARMGFAPQFEVPELPSPDPYGYQELTVREDVLDKVVDMDKLEEWLSCTLPAE